MLDQRPGKRVDAGPAGRGRQRTGRGGLAEVVHEVAETKVVVHQQRAGGPFAEEATTAVGCAVGVSIGKVGTVLALRRGASFRWARRIRDRPRKPAGKFRTRLRGWSDRMFGLLGEPRWGAAIVFLSACVYVPPLYPVTLAVADTRMSVIPFGIAVGEGVFGISVGDDVLGLGRNTQAEYAVLDSWAAKPSSVDWAVAAAAGSGR